MGTGDLIRRIYGNFRGIDLRGEELNLSRSPDSLNVWCDYRKTESITTRPKMKLYAQTDGPVYCISKRSDKDGDSYYAHIKDTLYFFLKMTSGKVHFGKFGVDYLQESRSQIVWLNDMYAIKTGTDYFVSGVSGNSREYIPTTTIGAKPSGGGTKYEDINLLTGERINTFIGDGESTEFFLDAQNLDSDYLYFEVRINDESVHPSDYTVDYEKGKVTFPEPPEAPLTDGQDNVFVKFCKRVEGNREKILNCTKVCVFDNRLFFGGNPQYPNKIWHSALNNPNYVSDLDYYEEGSENSVIKGMVAGNNALWVFKSNSNDNNSIFYHTPTIDSEYGKIYPSQHSNIAIGCKGGAVNFNDDIIFFSDRGMEGISGDITKEQAVAHRSTLVDSKLTSEPGYEDMILVEWEGYLMCIMGNRAYLADSRAKFNNVDHYEYEWFYWEFDKNILCATNIEGTLWLGTEDGIYTLTDYESSLESYWTTPVDKFKHPQMLKSSHKRGCVVEAKGDVSVFAKVEDTDFELIGKYENIKDYFVSRIKRKKFKDIQLKFHSDTRFTLETATLECFIGGYIKR